MAGRSTRFIMPALLAVTIVQSGLLAAIAWQRRAGSSGGGDIAPAARQAPGDGRWLFRVGAISEVPDPAMADYADCLAICAAEFLGGGRSESVALAIPAFQARRWTEFAGLEEGMTIAAHVVAFDHAPQLAQRTDIADTIESLDLPLFYCPSWEWVSVKPTDRWRFSEQLPRREGPPPGARHAISQAAVEGRVAAERARVERLLGRSPGGWGAWDAEAKLARMEWVEAARESGGALRSAGQFYFEPVVEMGYSKPAVYGRDAPSVKLLLDLDRQLDRAGVHLIVVPFPKREELTFRYAADPSTWPERGVAAPRRLQLFDTLWAAGVDVVDILPWLEELPAEALPFYDCADQHPANGSIVRVAEGLADILENYGVPRRRSTIDRSIGEHGIPGHRELFPAGARYRSLGLEAPITTLPPERSVMLVGDSYLRTPGSYGFDDATIVDHLSWEIGGEVSFVSTPAARVFQGLARNRHLREAASVVVFVCSPLLFTDPHQFRGYLDDGVTYRPGSL